ncbi:MAG: FHA domain-containing protein [Lachnospiraceae bacterium]|nr:FHA domain-containing protein [Lachnospiraceae bacterium]
MEIKQEFKRTATRNYIAVEKAEGYRDDYQITMIMENNIKGLLKMENRQTDGREYLYYDISSLQPLIRMYEHKGLSGMDIRSTVRNIVNALKEADEYMLEMSHIVLSPSCIYTDPDDRSIHMMFYPYDEDKEMKGMMELAEFFLERIERSDPDAAVFAYNFYKTVRKENYVLADLEAVADEGIVQKDGVKGVSSVRQNDGPGKIFNSENRQLTSSKCETINICKRTPTKASQDEKIPFALLAGGFSLMAVICLLVMSGIIPGVGQNAGEKIVAAALAVSFLAALIVCTVNRLKKDKPTDLKNSMNTERAETDKTAMDGSVPEKPDDFDSFFNDMTPGDLNGEDSKKENVSGNENTFGKTVFLSDDNEKPDNILEDRKGKEYRIDHFPFLIGKMADSADLVLNDRTVSRIHARITTENDHYFIQDCNSTNGTFLNGMELKGDEMAMLSKNDEIEIGHVKLNYR